MTDWLPYVLLIVCGIVFVMLGGWYRRQRKNKYLAQVSQVLGYPVTEYTGSSYDGHYHPLGSGNFCYCNCGGGDCGHGGGGDCKGDKDGACIILLVFAVLLSVAACLAWCPVEPHFQVEDKKKRKHVIYNTDSAYIYHGKRFRSLEELRERLRRDFEEGAEREEETAVVPILNGEIEGEEGSVPLNQCIK